MLLTSIEEQYGLVLANSSTVRARRLDVNKIIHFLLLFFFLFSREARTHGDGKQARRSRTGPAGRAGAHVIDGESGLVGVWLPRMRTRQGAQLPYRRPAFRCGYGFPPAKRLPPYLRLTFLPGD